MAFGTIMLVVAILSVIAVFRELKRRNFLAVGFAGITALILGWFGVMTLFVSGGPLI
ncbi:uncharacterized protein DUF2759 [Salsuginibacillus halophilus]|uniref:Uncharacterized protein DUF2759 n=1 Tax=Salsuginibacillus halophilus TaxID=517424 RepID=A0A2P8H832_9BACI|nr:DUF2759 domain-containing protein [Salsuginibacillus halophilus]PSL42349.1 uncharacterized protein DUF2759 [Salsuginibacillus halophilus]